MPNDVNRTIDAVTRTLSTRDVNGARAWVIVAARIYSAPAVEIWDALTNPARIPQWFLPVAGELRPGGRYQLEGNAGGEILGCDPPRRLAVTWEFGGHTSWVTVELSAGGSGDTRLVLENVAHYPAEMWNEFGPGAGGVGWDMALFGLEQYLTHGVAVDPQEAARWLTSEDGRRFVERSSDAWCAASVAAGTDPEAARAAAARTTAAYTGEAAVQADETGAAPE
jgi:uncharacterized protein YndB with AHSA1/START domain